MIRNGLSVACYARPSQSPHAEVASPERKGDSFSVKNSDREASILAHQTRVEREQQAERRTCASYFTVLNAQGQPCRIAEKLGFWYWRNLDQVERFGRHGPFASREEALADCQANGAACAS